MIKRHSNLPGVMAFIDIYSDFGIVKPTRKTGNTSPQYDASRTGYYWNDHIMPETSALEKLKYDSKKANELLEAGFGTVNTHHQDGNQGQDSFIHIVFLL